jgi:hypothetical protein
MGYTFTDEAETIDGRTRGEKWCTCTGGRWGSDCKKMLKKCDLGPLEGPEDYVCTSTSCSCTKAKTIFNPPQLEMPPTQGLAPVQPPTKRRFNRNRYKGVMSRGIDNLPPQVNPDPEPPALPAPYPKE